MYIKGNQYLFPSTDLFLKNLISSIRSSRESIDIECFYLSRDEIGQSIIFELILAARRGIHIRILVDGMGSFYDIPWLKKQLAHTSIELRIFNPLPLQQMGLKCFFYGVFNINKRTHRKLYIIDKTILFTGSINLSNDHFGTYNNNHWFDIGFKFSKFKISALLNSFEENWEKHNHSLKQIKKNKTRSYCNSLTSKNSCVNKTLSFSFKSNQGSKEKDLYYEPLLCPKLRNSIRNHKRKKKECRY